MTVGRLYPQLDESGMQMVLSDQAEINNRIYVFPTSAIMENGKKNIVCIVHFILGKFGLQCGA